MQAISQNHREFAARIARIESGVAASKQLLFVGMDEVYHVPLRARKVKNSAIRALFGNALYPVSLVLALTLGTASHGIGQIIRYQIQGLPDLKANPDLEMAVQVVLGFAIAAVLGYLMGLRSNQLAALKAAGVVIGLLFFHNAVRAYPEFFASLTSKVWVNQIVARTQAYSILWRGISLPL